MIEIIQLVGESLDLKSGEESSKGVVLTNGVTQAFMPVSEEQVAIIVRLYAASLDREPKQEAPARQSKPQIVPTVELVPPPADDEYTDDTGTGSV
jgi:hypothetical protein